MGRKNGSTRYDVVDVATDRPLRTHTHIRENFVDNPRTRQITEEGDEEQKKKKTGTKK